MSELDYRSIDRNVFNTLAPPPMTYYIVVALLGTMISVAGLVWMYQMKTGMGVAGISHPTGWGVYIANFVFWVGIAHSGTLISAILYLVRARFRDAVSRSAEAMTIFAIAVAGLFPLVHLGRFWVFYYILPYPSIRQIWPNFISPLLWDVMAISTYFTVSVIFFYVGLIPDLAAAREYYKENKGPNHPRTLLYQALSLGWVGSVNQWRHYGRSYLYFAALATPLVISVHSVVSWDFAMSLIPGWHSTIFAPYFVAGAIHSGLAMVLVLLIPMRKLLHMESLIEIFHFERVAQIMLVTGAILAYSYLVIPFMAWYSEDPFERQLELWRATQTWAWAYWSIIVLNVIFPASLAFRKLRRNTKWLFFIGIAVVAGMWIERYFLIPSPLSHDFLPHNWGFYRPTWVEITITAGSFSLFFFLFVTFSKTLPTIPLSDVKSEATKKKYPDMQINMVPGRVSLLKEGQNCLLGIFSSAGQLTDAAYKVKKNGFSIIEFYSPARIEPLMQFFGFTNSPVKWWTFAGALFGTISGYSLAIFCALQNSLIVGGKPPVSIIPYTIIAFEFTVLFGSIVNLIAFVHYTRLRKRDRPVTYDSRFSLDRFGLAVASPVEKMADVRQLFESSGVTAIREYSQGADV